MTWKEEEMYKLIITSLKFMKVGEEYTVHKNVSMEKRMEQKAALEGKIGYID